MNVCPQCKKPRNILNGRKLCTSCRTFNIKVNTGVIRKPDYPDTTIHNYKEPMKRVEDGFGYYGAIVTTTDGRHIQCHICGYFYANVGSHVSANHKADVKEYKETYGLRLRDGLLSPIEKMAAQQRYNKHTRKTPEEYKAMSKKGAAVIKENGTKRGGNQWNAQTRNEKGNCKDQTIAKIRHIAELNQGNASSLDFIREYGHGAYSSVLFWFETWTKGVEAAGLETYFQRIKRAKRLKKKEYKDLIMDFYLKHDRTPQTSDFNSDPELPGQRQVTAVFGTLNKARKESGVPELIYLNGKWQEGEDTGNLRNRWLKRGR